MSVLAKRLEPPLGREGFLALLDRLGVEHETLDHPAVFTVAEGPEIKAKLTGQALYPDPKCGSAFAVHLQRQSDLYARLIRELQIKAE